MRTIAAVATLLLIATACSLHEDESAAPVPPQLASGLMIPERCNPKAPSPSVSVTFVANGAAWAVGPRGGSLACLFPVRRPGPFAWGPRGDRMLIARLEVKSFGGAPSRPATRASPAATSWGRPIGKSIVFVGRGGRALLKAHPAGGGFTDVTPLRGVRYEQVVYHPSGLAFAFIVRRGTRQSLWISSNRGKEPRQLVHGRLHTSFDAIAFSVDGRVLYFAAQHGDAGVDLHRVDTGGADEAPVEWRGGPGEHVSSIVAAPGPGAPLAFTVGRSCGTRRAVVVTGANPKGFDALPDVQSSQAVGWIDPERLLVAAGGCGRRLDLYTVSINSRRARLVVSGVTAAAVRRAEAFPPPPLPTKGEQGGSGLA
jgi:hypothetical protein